MHRASQGPAPYQHIKVRRRRCTWRASSSAARTSCGRCTRTGSCRRRCSPARALPRALGRYRSGTCRPCRWAPQWSRWLGAKHGALIMSVFCSDARSGLLPDRGIVTQLVACALQAGTVRHVRAAARVHALIRLHVCLQVTALNQYRMPQVSCAFVLALYCVIGHSGCVSGLTPLTCRPAGTKGVGLLLCVVLMPW